MTDPCTVCQDEVMTNEPEGNGESDGQWAVAQELRTANLIAFMTAIKLGDHDEPRVIQSKVRLLARRIEVLLGI